MFMIQTNFEYFRYLQLGNPHKSDPQNRILTNDFFKTVKS